MPPVRKKKTSVPIPRGKQRKIIDWDLVDSLAAIHCTIQEILSVLDVDEKTLQAACKRQHKCVVSEYVGKKRGKGKASLRRLQWKAAEALDKTSLIWLGKQWLGQTDKVEQKIEHTGIGPIMIPDNKRDE